MLTIALLISGRAARYEVCLLPFLEKIDETKYKIDLFMSINDEMCPYYEGMKIKLNKWLRKLHMSRYNLPDDYKHTHSLKNGTRFINGKWVHYNQMSSYFNDLNAFNIAKEFSEANDIQYDYYMKFRSDLITNSFPNLKEPTSEIKLYSIIPIYNVITSGIYKVPVVALEWVWGNKETMAKYCNTYIFVLETLKKLDGNYYIGFEDCVADNVYHNNVVVEYVNIEYNLDKNRKIFDETWSEGGNQVDSNNTFIPVYHNNIDVKTVTDTSDIPAEGGFFHQDISRGFKNIN